MKPQPPMAPEMPTRRAFLRRTWRAGLAWTALGGAGVAAVFRTTGYSIDPQRAGRLRSLSSWQLAVVDAIALRICAADVPADAIGAPPSALDVGVGDFVDRFLTSCAAPMRRDVSALIGFVEHGWPIACGYVHRFTALGPDSQDLVLVAMERSRSTLVRGGFAALKNLMMMGYYRDARTWGVLGYDGPLVRRPAEGWVPLHFRPPPGQQELP